jgi:hypothetical protein
VCSAMFGPRSTSPVVTPQKNNQNYQQNNYLLFSLFEVMLLSG